MNIVIGKNSQLAQYVDKLDTIFWSANEVDTEIAKKADKIYFFFCEQRTFLQLPEEDYMHVNVTLTMELLTKLYNEKTDFYIYGSGDLWNNCEGGVTIDTPINYKYSPYLKSKHILTEYILDFIHEKNATNIHLIHPFNFNTPHRKEGFLFYKIFDSIIYKKKITTGNLDFMRDIVHPNFILFRSQFTRRTSLVGSGNPVNIKEFVSKLYSHFDMNIHDYLTEDKAATTVHSSFFYHKTKIRYNNLLEDTINDITKFKNKAC